MVRRRMKQFFADFVEVFLHLSKLTLVLLVLCAVVFGAVVGIIGLIQLAVYVAGGNIWLGSILAIFEFIFVAALIYAGYNYLNTWWSERCRRKHM